MSQAERALARTEHDKFRHDLDAHRIETGETDEIARR
jgi:hypothetical protein